MSRLYNKGQDYYRGKTKVRPILVGGPICLDVEFRDGEDPEKRLNMALRRVMSKVFEQRAPGRTPDAYLSRGVVSRRPDGEVPDGKVPKRNVKYVVVTFYRTEPIE